MKYKLYILKFIVLYFLILSPKLICQTNEIGLFAGGSIFNGDVGGTSLESIHQRTKPAFGFSYKNNINYYLTINLMIKRGELYANDQNSNELFDLTRNLNFKSHITEFGIITELNFRPFLSRDADYKKTPFMFIGISTYAFNPKTKDSNGVWRNLRAVGTEGQHNDNYPGREPYKLSGMAIPFGLGYKLRASNVLTINLSLGWRITFSDYIDDVSTTYVDNNIFNEIDAALADNSYTGMSEGSQRGNPYNNDKYGFFGISILYSIKDKVEGCENIVF